MKPEDNKSKECCEKCEDISKNGSILFDTCPCHPPAPVEKSKGEECFECSNKKLYRCQRHNPSPPVEKSEVWEAEFDAEFSKEDGLFNTESGWRIKADPKRIKSFIENLLSQAKKEIEHCDEPLCPECQLKAYNKGRKDTLAEVRKLIKEMKWNPSLEILLQKLDNLDKY